MITPVTMHDAICDFLEKEIAERYNLRSTDSLGNEFFRSPNVVRSGWILPRSADEHIMTSESFDDQDEEPEEAAIPDEYPFITPRIQKVAHVSGQIESVVTLDVLFGVYGPALYDEKGRRINDGSGYRDVWNLIESTRQAFWEQHTIDSKYRILPDFFEADMIDEQIYPYWEGKCTTKWHVMFPMPNPEQNFF